MPPTGQRVTSVYQQTDTPLLLATEAVIATLGGISTWSPDNVIRLRGWANLATNAGVTSVTLRIRRGSLTGALVGESVAPTTGASQQWEETIEAEDNPGDVAGQVYVLTATAAGGSGAAQTTELVATVG